MPPASYVSLCFFPVLPERRFSLSVCSIRGLIQPRDSLIVLIRPKYLKCQWSKENIVALKAKLNPCFCSLRKKYWAKTLGNSRVLKLEYYVWRITRSHAAFPKLSSRSIVQIKNFHRFAEKGEQELKKGGNETYAGRHRRRRENAIYCPSSDRASKNTFHMICRLFPRYIFSATMLFRRINERLLLYIQCL